ncbi:hypothetical protein RF11_08887 [Thelohanellus kitauei]|uniref:Uncharacterized protein n=1 Tax=Thelohanellus kitauei TaxID=669202 RepID=A0A0C2MYH0_THEKT|nr:hypothetical protein RF11_08887 [Thelohanellus kitauei]
MNNMFCIIVTILRFTSPSLLLTIYGPSQHLEKYFPHSFEGSYHSLQIYFITFALLWYFFSFIVYPNIIIVSFGVSTQVASYCNLRSRPKIVYNGVIFVTECTEVLYVSISFGFA